MGGSSIWKYVATDESREPWFERDEALWKTKDMESWLGVSYAALETAEDGLLDALDIARVARHLQRNVFKHTLQDVAGHISEAVLRDLEEHGSRSVFRQHAGYFCLARREFDAMKATLVTPEYRKLGMSLLRPMLFKYIPLEFEHRFFELLPSSIREAGLGLFLRKSRHLRKGTIVAEYAGRLQAKPDKDFEAYTVTLFDKRCINAFVDGTVTCFAAMANDNGSQANCALHEFEDLPNRAFLVSIRDIGPEEEVFVKYGAEYWDASSYDELKNVAKTPGSPLRLVAPDVVPKYFCRTCRCLVEKRIQVLHKRSCDDPLSTLEFPFEHLDSLPINAFTSCDDGASQEACNRAVYFVTNPKFTSGFTHEVVCTRTASSKTAAPSTPKKSRVEQRREGRNSNGNMHSRRRSRTSSS